MKIFRVQYRQHTQLIAVLIIMSVAIFLRMTGVGYGLPNLFVQDEYHEVMRALELANGNFNIDRTGKGGLYFILFALYAAYFIILHLFTGISKEEFAVQIVLDPTSIYLIGRLCSITISAMTIYIVYRFSRKYISSEFSYIPVFLVAINWLDVELSREIRVDVLLSFLSIASIYLITDLRYHPTMRNFIKCGVAIGLATTTKISGILLFAPLSVAIFAVGGYSGFLRSGLKEYRNHVFFCIVAFVLVLSATNPGIWKTLPGYLQLAPSFIGTSSITSSDYGAASATNVGHFQYYFDVLRQKFGLIVLLMAGAGAVIGLLKRNFVVSNIVLYTVVIFLVIAKTGSPTMYYPRYLLPIVVPCALLVCFLVASTTQSLGNTKFRDGLKKYIFIGFFVVGVYQSIQIYNQSVILNRADTRELAANWVGLHVEDGSVIAIEGTKITAARNAVPLRETARGIDNRIEHYELFEPRQAKYLRYLNVAYNRDQTISRFNLVLFDISDVPSLDVLRSQNVRYVVVDPDRMKNHRSISDKGPLLLRSLYDVRNAQLIFKIDAAPSVRPGPSVYIFELGPI